MAQAKPVMAPARPAIASGPRPLSPHLQIYRWPFTMMMSIVHRATGIATTVGLLGLTWFLLALAAGPEAFADAQWWMDNILGGLVLFGFSLAFFLHGTTGIRHLFWDLGIGCEKAVATQTGVVAGVAGIALALLTWLGVLIVNWGG